MGSTQEPELKLGDETGVVFVYYHESHRAVVGDGVRIVWEGGLGDLRNAALPLLMEEQKNRRA